MSDLRNRFPIYSTLLRFYPAPYRERYEEEILQTTADMLDEAVGIGPKLSVWTHVAVDMPINIGKQQLSYVGGIMAHETPKYLKRNALIAGVMMLPFILAILANGLSKVVTNHDLYHSWLWSTPYISIWVLILPELTFLLALVTYIFYLTETKGDARKSWAARATDVRHVWPIVIPAVVAFGVLLLVAFHDSVQCWNQNPAHTVTHLQQTWHCTMQNRSLQGFRHL